MISTYLSLITHDTIALLTIFNPIAAASIMVTMISDTSAQNLRVVSFKATMTIVIASLITLFGGELIFKLFGINVLSLKVIGGVILMMIAINMAYGHPSKARHTPEEQEEAGEKEDISVVPLGIPLLFGPGTIATIIVLNSNMAQQFTHQIAYMIVTLSIFLSAISIFFILRYAGTINKLLGVTGMKILTRIMGLIVGAIASQFLVSGIKGLWGQ